mgnify:CR=1 FL=1
MNKLFLDTCTGELLVGLIHDGNVSTFEKLTGKRTSEKMLPTIQDLLNKEGLFLKDVDEVYVTKGPGSYTGSRLGLTFAKVLKVLNKNLKVFTCSTLQAMLAAASLEKSIALIDARNEAFFASINIKDENDCGHYAYTDNNGLEEEYVIFNIGSENAESEISKDLVIPVEQAYIAAIDFFETCEMSKRMKWFEL